MPERVGLVLAGGGSRCAWQAGVLDYIAISGRLPTGIHFVAGTSGGALNALSVASHTPGSKAQLVAIARQATDLWGGIQGPRDLFRLRPRSVLWPGRCPSVFSTKRLLRLLRASFDPRQIRASSVQLHITGVDLRTGQPVTFDQDHPQLLRCALASAAVPVAFPPVELDGALVTDGGVRDNAPLGAAIRAGCNRVLVLLPLDPAHPEPLDSRHEDSALQIGLRAVELLRAEVLLNDIRTCELTNALVYAGASRGRRPVRVELLTPSDPLGSGADFAPYTIGCRIAQGRADAEAHFERLRRG